MKSAASIFCSGYWIAVSICLISSSQGRAQNYQDGRAVYLSHAPNKAGWRPIVTAGSVGMSGLVTYNLGNVAKQNNQPKNQLQATQKIMTGPANQETKQGIANSPRPHLKGFSADYFGSAISTSTRPLVTRDLNNKLSTLGQNYKTSHFPLNSLNYNAPINSYMNPFSLGASNNPYKLTQGYQFDNNAFIRHQQSLPSHRPVYNNHQGQIMQGKRQKVNQLQAQILQQIAANQYHQSLQSYHNSLARPVESHPRPVEEYSKLNSNKNQGNNNNKGNINNQGSNNNPGNNNAAGNNKPVNPHESLSKLTKAHNQNVSPVTYKPPLGSQFQHFGVQEDSFGPIPSSILGSFSSFGHASVKARDPVIYNSGKTGYLATPTKSPYISNETFGSTSAVNTDVVVSPQSPSSSANSVQNFNSGSVKDDFSSNLVPPPQVQTHYENYQHKNYSAKNLTSDKINSFSSPSTQSNFFSSPSVQSNSFSNPSVQSNSFSNPSVQSNSFSNPSVQSNSFSNPSIQSNSFSNPSVQTNSFSNPSGQSNSFSSPSASGGSFSSPAVQGNFIPSPLDPLSKYQGSLDSQRFPSIKLKQQQNYVYNTNLSTKRPGVSSFFDSTLSSVSTIDPFEPQSTNIVPENLLVQLPPPYNSFNPFNGQSIKLATNHKDKYQAFSSVNHNSPISNTKYQVNEDIQFFPPREQEYFGTKYNTNNYQTNAPKTPAPHKYEVTETWGPSGEAITQPTLHSWLNPSQSFQQFSIPSKALGSSKTPSKEIPKHENKLLSQPYFPTSVPSSTTQEISSDVTTIYSTIAEKNQNNFLNQLENSLTPIKEIISDRKKPDLTAFSSPSPVYSSTAFNIQSETPPKVTSEIYDEVTTRPNVRRKPSRYRPQQETSTASSAEEDYTTRFETFKEHVPATENELQVLDLQTIPPSKFFKRPVLTTPSATDNWNEEKTKKRNKLRRRRPSKPSTTTEEVQEETIATTDIPVRTYNRYRTTSPAPEAEDVTKPLRPRFRYNHKARPTRPTSQSESTSSAQPTTLPTSPVTTRPKLHSRIRGTTQSSLDFEDLSETTTIREPKVSATVEQSSIMKIAKDHHFHRSPSTKYSPTGIGIFNDSPDYSHKQDEKDTPTSDISVNTFESKYSSQKFREGSSINTEEFQNIKTKNHDSAHHSSNLEVQVTPTLPTLLDENLATTYVQASQSTRVVQFTDLKSGNRGSTKPEENLIIKTETDEDTVPPTAESEPITTTPASSATKSNRVKTKSTKYDTNRPRFSVKDYRNRLNQYSSTSSTEKPVEVVSRNRFPNRSRFPSFKDPYGDSKSAGSEQSTSTEQPRKKFMPKDPRHKGGDENIIEETLDNNVVPSIRVPPSQKANFTQENAVITKAPRVRGSIRRDPARKRTTTSTETPFEVKEERTEKHTQKSNNVYTISKRPNLPTLRKRGQNATKNVEIMEMNPTEPIISIVSSTENVLFILEDDNKAASTEKSTSETAIMKIAKEERKHPVEEAVDSTYVDPSQRVADLTLAASKEYNTSGLFKSVSPNTRRVPDYFTIATDDPILPIEAFFPQLNQKKDS